MKALILFPHQLYKEVLRLPVEQVILLEHPIFFNLNFHNYKLVYHRATMKYFADELRRSKKTVIYISYNEFIKLKNLRNLSKNLHLNTFVYFDVNQHQLANEIKKLAIKKEQLDTPNFLTSLNDLKTTFYTKNGTRKEKVLMNSFYLDQRKRLKILIDDKQNPFGGKWSFDQENRKKIPKEISIPQQEVISNKYLVEAQQYVESLVQKDIDVSDWQYALTHRQANALLKKFLKEKINNFGTYQDAIDERSDIWFHSLLSAPLNIGLIQPKDIIDEIKKIKVTSQNIASIEGFVRQIIGWREYMRGIYLFYSDIQKKNYFRHKNKIPKSFWAGATHLYPLDCTIKKVQNSAYAHHIERLMILGNFLLLIEVDPDEVYKWFMSQFIDAYDWVMFGNVYAMSQFSCGELLTSKPYISSSNYILKMSSYKKGAWSDVWDALYWQFIYKHRKKLEKNNRMKLVLANYERLSDTRKKELKKTQKRFLKALK